MGGGWLPGPPMPESAIETSSTGSYTQSLISELLHKETFCYLNIEMARFVKM